MEMNIQDLGSKNFDALIAESAEEAQIAALVHNSKWSLGEEKSWHIDQANAQLLLTFEKGIFALAPAQIIGTYQHRDGVFLWAWDNPSVVEGMKEHVAEVRKFGKEHGVKELTKSSIKCHEHRAWELTALAMRINNAKGVYRVMVRDNVSLFLTFGEVHIAHET